MSAKIDGCVLALWFLGVGGLIYYADVPLLVLTVPLFVLPALFLLLRRPKQVLRDLWGAVLLGVVFGFMVDYFGGLNQAWVYLPEQFFFEPLVGHVRPDIMIWAFCWAFFIILFFEHFFDAHAPAQLSRWYLPMTIFSCVGILSMLVLPQSADLLRVPYAYLVWGIISWAPVLAVVWLYPAHIPALLTAAAFLAIPNILFEWAALKAGYWSFGGEYVWALGMGSVSLPVEEVMFWTVGSSLIVLSNFFLFVRRS